ncbi:MAG: DNA-binding protein [Magnetococcales bacterium]|nr:DNA-binding protein [Magnetococcales bacterium]
MIFEFTVVFSIQDQKQDVDEISNRLFDAGLDDALVLTGIKGIVGLDLFRESISAEEAINSAINDFFKAFPDAELIEVRPDLVSIADIAKLVGQSRQNLRKLAGFPPPIITGAKPYWHLYQVIRWYETKKRKKPFAPNIVETAKSAWRLNHQLESRRLELSLQ